MRLDIISFTASDRWYLWQWVGSFTHYSKLQCLGQVSSTFPCGYTAIQCGCSICSAFSANIDTDFLYILVIAVSIGQGPIHVILMYASCCDVPGWPSVWLLVTFPASITWLTIHELFRIITHAGTVDTHTSTIHFTTNCTSSNIQGFICWSFTDIKILIDETVYLL